MRDRICATASLIDWTSKPHDTTRSGRRNSPPFPRHVAEQFLAERRFDLHERLVQLDVEAFQAERVAVGSGERGDTAEEEAGGFDSPAQVRRAGLTER